MNQTALVIIKPDGIAKSTFGHILTKFSECGLEIVGIKMVTVSKDLAEEHYKHLKGKPFFKGVIDYLMGKYHQDAQSMAIVYCGKNAIKKCRILAGLTNPEEADPKSIRGAFGRITTKGVYENVVHVSSDKSEAKREIQLWFQPEELSRSIYPEKKIKELKTEKRAWK